MYLHAQSTGQTWLPPAFQGQIAAVHRQQHAGDRRRIRTEEDRRADEVLGFQQALSGMPVSSRCCNFSLKRGLSSSLPGSWA
ncbi:MAG: hypothetical protein R2838_14260 [Caldilineaceae bacterium]